MIGTKYYILINNIRYYILDYKKRDYQISKRGVIDEYFKGVRNGNWLINYTDYYVEVRDRSEDFNRTFVLTEREAQDLLFKK